MTNWRIKSSQNLCYLDCPAAAAAATIPTSCFTAAAAAISATSTVPFRALTNHSAVSTAVLIIPFYYLTYCLYQPLF